MVVAWVLTLPAAGAMGALAHEGVQAFATDTAGVIGVGIVALAIASGLFWLAQRSGPVSANNVIEPSLPAAHAGTPLGAHA